VASRADWQKILRKTIKLENGEGWSLRGIEIKGVLKTQVTHRHREDGTRETTFIPYEWNSRNQTKITTAVAELKRLIEDRNLTIKEAEKFRVGPTDEGSAATVINWASVADEFCKSRSGNRVKTQQDLQTRMNRALEIFKLKPKPINGKTFMEKYADKYFNETYTDRSRKGKLKLPIGGQGRKRNYGDISAFFKFAVSKGAPPRWLLPEPVNPENKQWKKNLLGVTTKSETVPLKGEQFEELMEMLDNTGNHELRLAVGLIGIFGLRPAELAVLEVKDDNKLYVGEVKNNPNKTKEIGFQRVIALDLPSLPNEGEKLVEQYKTGKLKLPFAIRQAINKSDKSEEGYAKVGQALRQLLDRHWYWKRLKKKVKGLKPYSLRHGYAWRAHMESDNPQSIRAAAKLMRHETGTHTAKYGSWIDESELEESVAKFIQGQKV